MYSKADQVRGKAQKIRRAALLRDRAKVVREIASERGEFCEARIAGCQTIAVDAHEKVRRSQGGSVTDADNIILVCRHCHDWIHRNPRKAKQRGLLEVRNGTPETD